MCPRFQKHLRRCAGGETLSAAHGFWRYFFLSRFQEPHDHPVR
jgi:hypothetical protein